MTAENQFNGSFSNTLRVDSRRRRRSAGDARRRFLTRARNPMREIRRSTLGPEQLEDLWRPYRQEFARDYVSLSELFRRSRRVRPSLVDERHRAITLELLGYVLDRGEARVGQFDRGTFEAWEGMPQEVVQRVEIEWEASGKADPGVGEIAWLSPPREFSLGARAGVGRVAAGARACSSARDDRPIVGEHCPEQSCTRREAILTNQPRVSGG